MFDWWDFLGVAERMAGTSDEAERRTAISRTYYAAFGTALAWRKGCRYFETLEDGSDHQRLWAEFKESADGDERYIGELGSRLRRRRNAADYWPRVDELGDMVADSIEDARYLRELLDTLPC